MHLLESVRLVRRAKKGSVASVAVIAGEVELCVSHHHDGESFLLAINTGDSVGVFTVTLFAISAGCEGLFVGVGGVFRHV